jgi:pentatricopeptide repeat protein
MHWGAAQIVVQFRRAAFQLLTCRDTFFPILRPPTAFRVQCISGAIALQARAIFATPTLPEERHHSSSSARNANYIPEQHAKTRGLKPPIHPMRYLPQPRWDLVKMVDTLFRQRRDEYCTLDDLKSYWMDPEALSHLQDPAKARELAILMVNTGVPRRAFRVLVLAHAFGCPLKQNAYEGVAYQLQETRQWAEMPALVALGRRHMGRSTARLLNWRARALVEISHFGQLNRVLDDFKEEDLSPNRKTFHALVSGNLRNRDLAKVKECLSWMEEAGFPMDASTHALFVSNCRTIGPDAAVQEQGQRSLPDLEPQSATAVVNSLIQLSLDTRDIKSALKFLSFFDTPSPKSVVIDGRRDRTAGEDGETRACSVEAVSGHRSTCTALSPDITTFTMLMNYAARMHDLPLALQMVERVKHSAARPDASYLAALIRVYCSARNYQTALSIVAATCKDVSNVMPLLHALGLDMNDTGRPDLIPTDIALTQRMANALLGGILEYRGLGALSDMKKLMKVTGLTFDSETLEILMSYMATRDLVRPRELNSVLKMLPRQFKPTQRHVQILLRAIVGRERALVSPSGGWPALRRNHSKPRGTAGDRSEPPHRSMEFSNAMETLQDIAASILRKKQRLGNIVHRLVRSLTDRRQTADKATVQIGLLHDATVTRNVERAKETLRSMYDRGMSPNEYHYAALMEGYCLSGRTHIAEKVFRRAQADGYGQDPVLFTILIHGYARMGRPQEATRIFQAMLSKGVEPDVGSVDALASAYYAVRAYASARQVIIQSWSRFGLFPEDLKAADLKTLIRAFRELGDQHIVLDRHSRRMLKFQLKRIKQNIRPKIGRRRKKTGQQPEVGTVGEDGEMKHSEVGKKGRHLRRDVLHGTPDNKHTILQ